LAEIITHGENGCTAPSEDTHAWVSSITKLLEETSFAAGLAETAKNKIHNEFNWMPIAAATVELYMKAHKNIIFSGNPL
jgi:glycosyltransferase involved in cell wall biosynthesis